MDYLFNQYLDVTIAVVLILVGLTVFLISRIGMLPKKSLPFIAAAFLGAIGVSVFHQWRRNKLLKEIDERKESADKRKAELDRQKQELEKSSAAIEARKKELDERDGRLAVLEEKRALARENLNRAETALAEEYKVYQETVRRASEDKKAEIETIDNQAAEMDDRQLLEALLNLARNS